MKNKKLVSALLIFSILITFLISGCGTEDTNLSDSEKASSEKESSTEESTSSDSDEDNSTEKNTLITDEPISLSCFIRLAPNTADTLKSNADVKCFKEMEKRTGIKIDWMHPPVGQEDEQFNLMIASNELPDLIFWNWNSVPGGPTKAINDEIIIKLNEHIDKSAPNLKAIFDENPEVHKQSVLDDGTIYQFPMIRLREEQEDWFKIVGPCIRQDWLDKLDLEKPKTIDDLYGVLKAFKDNDVNNNGDPNDEIPFISNKDSGIRALAAAWGVSSDFYKVNNEVKFGPIEPEFKNYVETMNKWYKEGLIDKEFAVTDGKSFDAKITGNKGGVAVLWLAGGMGRYLNLMEDENPEFDLRAIPWPTGPGGQPYTNDPSYNKLVPGHGTTITTANEHIEESVKWLDYMYSDEGHMLMTFGIEGETYTIEDNTPKYTDLILSNPEGYSIDQALSRYTVQISDFSIVKDSHAFEQVQLALPQQKEAQKEELWGGTDTSLLLPPITLTEEESANLSSIMSEIDTYCSEMITKFIMDQEPMEKYDKFVEKLKKMHIDDAIKINQAALDRYNAR